jgi:hypothetical protein
MSDPDTPDVLAALREETGARHALIDSAMPLSDDAARISIACATNCRLARAAGAMTYELRPWIATRTALRCAKAAFDRLLELLLEVRAA